MTTERFALQQFTDALPHHKDTSEPMCSALGLVDGEYCFRLPINGGKVAIEIRSSIDASGIAADTGSDSIRAWLVNAETGKPIGSKSQRWVCRTKNWRDNLTEMLRTLYQWRMRAGDCPDCDEPLSIYKVKKDGPNKGRPFAKCREHNHFRWLDQEDQGHFQNGGEAHSDSVGEDESPQAPQAEELASPSKDSSSPIGLLDGLLGDGESTQAEIEDLVEPSERRQAPPSNGDKAPNPKQLEAITAPIDGATRVIAPPGAGKTFVMARRYAFMLDNGVTPDDILAVTFSKTMADELLERICKVNPSVRNTAAEKQVCTIHAACYRMLKAEGDNRRVSKNWQIKRNVQELAEELWPYSDERPGWDEIYSWMCSAKSQGLTTADDLDFFIRGCGDYHGRKLHEIRRKFDERMQRERLLTFSDMLLDVETKLRRDRQFRNKYQTRYKHVIIDEAQDVGAQALRILITLSFDPGNNPVYER